MKQGLDYTVSNNSIAFVTASTPQTGDTLLASYRFANPANVLGTLTAAQVVCSAVGASTSSTTLTLLATYTLPAGLIGTGDRIEVQFQYAHSGTATGFTGEIHWGGTTVISRAASASESAFAGKMAFGVYSGAQSWDTQRWGSSLGFAAATGTAAENTAQSLTISFRGSMAGATTDTVILRNFTVLRYPAQSNP